MTHRPVAYVRTLPVVVITLAPGIRRHRITLTDRPNIRRLTPPRPRAVPGPAVYDARVDPPRFSHWSTVATLFFLTALCTCVGLVELPHR